MEERGLTGMVKVLGLKCPWLLCQVGIDVFFYNR